MVICRTARACSILAFVAVLSTCSTGDDAEEDAEPPASTSTVASAPTSTTTTVATVPLSSGTIQVGESVYELAVTCYAAGAGEVLAIGVGSSPETGEPVEAYVQAYLGSPYVGLRVGSGEDSLIESTFDGPLDLYLQDDRIRASAIRFVRDLDLETGAGEPAGVGRIEIECEHYEEELPS